MITFPWKKQTKTICLSLMLRETKATAILLSINNETKSFQELSKKEFNYSNSWEQILPDVDNVLFELEQQTKTTATEVIFFLHSHMIDFNKQTIKNLYFEAIKLISKELDLKTKGYMEFHECVYAYLNTQNHIASSALLVEYDLKNISIFYYDNNKFDSSLSIATTDDILKDFEKALMEIAKDRVLPGLVFVYGEGDIDKFVSLIRSTDWADKYFVQIPKIELLQQKEIEHSLLFNFEKQIFDNDTITAKNKQTETQELPFGFVANTDIIPQEKNEYSNIHVSTSQMPVQNPFITVKGYSEKISNNIKNNLVKLQTIQNKWIYLILLSFIIIVLSSIYIITTYFKSTVVLYYQINPIKKELLVSNSKLFELSKEILSIEETINTTGKKSIGERAKGSLLVINQEKSSVTLDKDTKFKSNSGLEFILDNSITIASSSQTITDEGNILVITGKEKVPATADDIGPNYNISKDTTLTASNNNAITATAIDQFTGGSKAEIQTVSENDVINLRKKILSQVPKLTITNEQKNNSELILKDTIQSTISSETFSAEIAEEADSLTGKAKVKVTYYTNNADLLKDYLLKQLDEKNKKGMILTTGSLKIISVKSSIKDNKVKAIYKISILPKPNINEENIKKEIAGKLTNNISDIITKKYKAKGYEILPDSRLPFSNYIMPILPQNIDLQIRPY